MTAHPSAARLLRRVAAGLGVLAAWLVVTAAPALAAPSEPRPGTAGVKVQFPDITGTPSSSVTIILAMTVLAVAPALLLLCTSFTKIFVVLSLTRNALGLQSVPPNQVLAGLSLFLSLFVMGPVMSKINSLGIQPYLHGTKNRAQAWHDGVEPLRQFMLSHTRPQEIALMLRAGNLPNPPDKAHLDLTTLIPAFVLSELRS